MNKEQIVLDIRSAKSLPDYEAVDVLWGALTKAVCLMDGENERQKIASLVEKFSNEEIKGLLKGGSVDSLIFMDPPLETALCGPDEKPDEDSTMRAIGKVRSSRETDPKDALINLVEILKKIQNNLSSNIETESGPLNKEILLSSRKILYLLCMLAVSKI